MFREQDGIDVRVLHEVDEINTSGKRVYVRDLNTGTSAWETYDQLPIATGAVTQKPPTPAPMLSIF